VKEAPHTTAMAKKGKEFFPAGKKRKNINFF